MNKSISRRLSYNVYTIIFIILVFATVMMIFMTTMNVMGESISGNAGNFKLTDNSFLNFVPVPLAAILFGRLAYMARLKENLVEISPEKIARFKIINIVLIVIVISSILCLELFIYPSESLLLFLG